MKMNKNKKLLYLVETGVLASLGVVFMLVIRFTLLPSVPFLEYDMGDIPVIMASMFLGTGSGSIVLFIVSLIQSLTVSAQSNWEGFVMHFLATGTYIIVLNLLRKKLNNKTGTVISLVASTLLMTLVMIPLNLIFTPLYTGWSVKAVSEIILPAIVPFNLLKGVINSLVVFLTYYPLRAILTKSNLLPKK